MPIEQLRGSSRNIGSSCIVRWRCRRVSRLIHVSAFNLSLISRGLVGAGTPPELKARLALLVFLLERLVTSLPRPTANPSTLTPRQNTFQAFIAPNAG